MSDELLSLDSVEKRNYILGPPLAEELRRSFRAAAEELMKPYPSTPLLDFPKFSKLIGGFRPREFTILCGATGIGKTTLNANMSASLVKQKIPHFVASVETGRTDYVKRIMSCMARTDWNTGDPVAPHEVKEFSQKHRSIIQANSLYLSLYENRFGVETLMSDIAWMAEKRGCKIAIIDNLNFFLDVRKSQDQLLETDRVIHELIIFCKQVDVHIVMVMHPKKTDHGRVESEFEIKGSSTAVQEAHNVFLFNRAGKDLIEAKHAADGDREIKIAKMRRKGRSVGSRLVLRAVNGVTYLEGDVVV